jgi:hypothetical protein
VTTIDERYYDDVEDDHDAIENERWHWSALVVLRQLRDRTADYPA